MKINVNDVVTNYLELGSKNGVPIIYLHGFALTHKMWQPQFQLLPNHLRSIFYDIRGHGLSSIGDGQYTLEYFVDDLYCLMSELEIEKAIICGLSMGGYIALRFIEKYPEKVMGLILCDTKSEADNNDAKIKRANTIRTVKTKGVKIFASDFLATILCDYTFKNNISVVEQLKTIILENSPFGICGASLAICSRTDTTQVLNKITIPTCLMFGEYDILTPINVGRFLQNNISGAELNIIKNAGHMSNIENMEQFNENLIKFIKTNFLSINKV